MLSGGGMVVVDLFVRSTIACRGWRADSVARGVKQRDDVSESMAPSIIFMARGGIGWHNYA